MMTENRVFADESGVACTYRYALYLPDGYAKGKKYPIVFFLHGAGERGDDVKLVRVHGPFKHIDKGEKFDVHSSASTLFQDLLAEPTTEVKQEDIESDPMGYEHIISMRFRWMEED